MKCLKEALPLSPFVPCPLIDFYVEILLHWARESSFTKWQTVTLSMRSMLGYHFWLMCSNPEYVSWAKWEKNDWASQGGEVVVERNTWNSFLSSQAFSRQHKETKSSWCNWWNKFRNELECPSVILDASPPNYIVGWYRNCTQKGDNLQGCWRWIAFIS